MEFRGDERGQPVLIGFLLLFAMLVVAFGTYQGVVVPNQNAEVEFDHSQDVNNEFLDLRNGLMRTAVTGEATFNGLTLGTRYPSRVIALNPSPASGTVETTAAEQISVEAGNGQPLDVCAGRDETRRLTYRASYNEFSDNPTFAIENTVAYRQFDGTERPDTAQILLRGSAVNLVTIEGEFEATDTGSISIDPIPGAINATSVDDPNVTVPTGLDGDTWGDLLADELGDNESYSVDGGDLTLSLDGTYAVTCLPVGVDEVPDDGERDGGALAENPVATFESVTANVTESNNGRIQSVEFDWETTRKTTLEFRIIDNGTGNVAGEEIVYNAPESGSVDVLVDNGDHGSGDAQNYPVRLEAEIRETGETCAEVVQSGDTGPYTLCE